MITVLHVTVTICVICSFNCSVLSLDSKGNNYVIPIDLYTFDISLKKKEKIMKNKNPVCEMKLQIFKRQYCVWHHNKIKSTLYICRNETQMQNLTIPLLVWWFLLATKSTDLFDGPQKMIFLCFPSSSWQSLLNWLNR